MRWSAIALVAAMSWAEAQVSVPVANQDYVDLWVLYRESSTSDPRILGAEAQVRNLKGQERAAFGQMLPQLSAGGSSSRVRREEASQRLRYSGESYNVNLSQALYNPAAWRGFKRYEQLTEQYKAQSEDARIQSAADLVERYFNVLAAEEEVGLVVAQRTTTQRNLDRARALLERQMGTVTDVLQIAAKVDSLNSQEIQARNAARVAREALGELTGKTVYQPLKRLNQDAQLKMPQGDEAVWVSMAIANNPALRAKQKAVEAAGYGISEAQAGHLPTLNFNLGAQRSDFAYENVLASSDINTYSATISLQIPLYSGGSTSARIESFYGARDAAEQDYEAIRRQITKETKTAYMQSASDLSMIASSRRALDSAVKAREVSEQSLSFGVVTAVDVLSAVQQEFSARRDYLKAQYNFVTNQLVLLRWSGGFQEADIKRINQWLVVPDAAAAVSHSSRKARG